MRIKILIVIGAMLAATTAFAQNSSGAGAASGASPNTGHEQQPQTPGGQTNAQGEHPKAGQTMQEKGRA